ncbi:MAG: YfiR family protein [Ginsengibacter sp.]
MLKRFIFFVLILTLSQSYAWCQSQEGEYNLKAAFVYNFTKYITWGTFVSENDFIIGVIGSSPVYEPLAEIARTKTVNDKKIIIKHFDKPEDISYCNILYIPKNTPFPLYSIFTRLNNGTLTISEEEGYAQQGTAFNFVLVKDKLRFESNIRAINSAGLKASSQLLKLAIIVEQ